MGCGRSRGSVEPDPAGVAPGERPADKSEQAARNKCLISVQKKMAFCEPGHRIVTDLTEDLRRAAARISSGEAVSPEEFESNEVPDTEPPPPLRELEKFGLMGCGGFGKVELVEHGCERTYALKTLSKGYIEKTGTQQAACLERLLLSIVRSPFVVSFFGSYNEAQTVSLLLEPLMGGELYATYNRKGFHGKYDHARYYIASICVALEHLHALRIVCRGIKPEDCVLDSGGHLKLVDLGLSKPVAGLTYTTCGTPDYFPPEMIQARGHSLPADWWSVGILCFELLAGHPPFDSAHPMQIYSKVMKGIQNVTFPKSTGEAKDFVVGKCQKDPQQRLPVRRGGIANLRQHKWFGAFDWGALENQTMEPPYLPSVKHTKDLSNFSARKEDAPAMVALSRDTDGWDREFGIPGKEEEVKKEGVELEDGNQEPEPQKDESGSVRVVQATAVASSIEGDDNNVTGATVNIIEATATVISPGP
mmetsp:Transcript_22431/g.62985  ORF Transcript_22431/g.62985 Transcript_22431/m.62985 type:complete len:476 (+) Transcript_22431:132-1559(+)